MFDVGQHFPLSPRQCESPRCKYPISAIHILNRDSTDVTRSHVVSHLLGNQNNTPPFEHGFAVSALLYNCQNRWPPSQAEKALQAISKAWGVPLVYFQFRPWRSSALGVVIYPLAVVPVLLSTARCLRWLCVSTPFASLALINSAHDEKISDAHPHKLSVINHTLSLYLCPLVFPLTHCLFWILFLYSFSHGFLFFSQIFACNWHQSGRSRQQPVIKHISFYSGDYRQQQQKQQHHNPLTKSNDMNQDRSPGRFL